MRSENTRINTRYEQFELPSREFSQVLHSLDHFCWRWCAFVNGVGEAIHEALLICGMDNQSAQNNPEGFGSEGPPFHQKSRNRSNMLEQFRTNWQQLAAERKIEAERSSGPAIVFIEREAESDVFVGIWSIL